MVGEPTPMNPTIAPPNRRPPVFRSARLPFWLLAVAALVNFHHLSIRVFGTAWLNTIGIALLCAYLCLTVRIPFRRTLGAPGFLIVAALTSYFLIGMSVALIDSIVWNGLHDRVPFHVGLAVLIVVASALGASAVLRRISVKRLLKGILAILAVACVLILATPWIVDHFYPLTYLQNHTSFRFMGTFGTPNHAGIVACYAVALALSLSLDGGRYRKFATFVVILGSVAVILTFSRTAVITLALLFLFFLIASVSNLRLGRMATGVWLAVMIVVGGSILAIVNLEYLPIKDGQQARLTWIINLGTLEENLNTRLVLWPLALSQIAEAPLFGHGITHFHSISDAPLCRFGIPCGSHNAYLMLWGEAGIAPLTLFLLFIGSLLWRCLTLPKSVATNTVAGWALVFALDAVSNDGTLYFVWHGFTMGLSCAMITPSNLERFSRD